MIRIALFFVGLLTTPLFAYGQVDFAGKESLRADHEFLFKEFVGERDCTWSEDPKRLKEVVVKKECTVENGEKLILDKGSQKISKFFRYLVFQGSGLPEFDLKCESCRRQSDLKLHYKNENESVFLLPRRLNPEMPFSLLVSAKAQVKFEKILFRSHRGVDTEFDDLMSYWLTFAKGKYGKIQREFFLKTTERSFEELSTSMSENSQVFRELIAPAQMTSGVEFVNMQGIFMDRRVSKLYEGLELFGDNAAAVAEQNFALEFASFCENLTSHSVTPLRMRYAVESHLFLCSEFCTPTSVVEKIDLWQDWYERERKERGFQFKKHGGPDYLFTGNLYANLIMKKENLSIAQMNGRLREILTPVIPSYRKPPQLKRFVLMASDWTTNRPIGLTEVPVLLPTGSISEEAVQNLVLLALRDELDR